MNSLLSRYLDGELDEEEAREFLDDLERDPELARELARTERLLAVGRSMVDESAPDDFTDTLMKRIAEDEVRDKKHTPTAARRVWLRPLAAAAVLALAFFGGMQAGLDSDPAPPTQTVTATSSAPSLHSVRLVYVPPQEDRPQQVYVAGDFNDWRRDATPLSQVDGVWTTTLVLPSGDYEYMFVEDDERWVTDPLATRTRADGFGGNNAVLDVGA